MPRPISDRTAVVTGGSSGIGAAAALALADAGARVVIVGRDEQRLARTADHIGHHTTWIAADLAHDTGAQHLADQLKTQNRLVDVLFANAGTANAPRFADTTEDDVDAVIAANLKTTFFTVLRCLPLLRDGASVILTSSVGAHRGSVGEPLYNASKAAVTSLAKSLANRPEFLDRRIRVNSIAYGTIATPMTGFARTYTDPALSAWAEEHVPLRRWADPIEAARPVVFLASPDSSYITGTELTVDGGISA